MDVGFLQIEGYGDEHRAKLDAYTESVGEVSRVIECSDCHTVLADGVGVAVPDGPCPACGSSTRQINLGLEAKLSVTSRTVAHKDVVGGGPVGEAVRVSGPYSRTASGDVTSDTVASYGIGGPAPRGEEGRLETASLLLAKLAEEDDVWGPPEEVDEADVDCRRTRDGETLDIQVTRAVSPEVWRQLHQTGAVQGDASPSDLADGVLTAIQKKSLLPAVQRARLVLCLDARDTPVVAMGGVVESFRTRHLETVARLGFRGVWVVGPTVQLVHRLDA